MSDLGLCFLCHLTLPPSTYDIDHLLGMENVGEILCPDQFPEGQPCSLPLRKGVYGGGDPILYGPMELGIFADYLDFFEGDFDVKVEVSYPDGSLFACNNVKFVLAQH